MSLPGTGLGDRHAHRRPLAAAILVVLLLAAVVFSQLRVRTDMADFIPAGGSQAARLMEGEIRSGAVTSLILVAIEGVNSAELARISNALADGMRASGAFRFVANGRQLVSPAEREWLFRYRYLLSPGVTASSFEAGALRSDFERLLRGLQGAASPVLERIGFADPTGAFLALAGAAEGSSHVQTRHGVWFAAGAGRALLIARMQAGGLDVAAQDRALAAIRRTFAASRPGTARLLLAGPAIFAHDAAQAIRHDIELLSIVSTLLVAAVLVWRFRSPWVIAAIGVPIVLSICVAALVVQIVFGFVHGITLGFGTTMLGVSVDYPVLLIGHRKRGEAAPATLRRIGPAFNLAVATAALGLAGMTFSGFPGLSQLGLFSVTGVLTAAAATRWFLPRLIVAADLAPVAAGDPALLRRLERLRAWRGAALLPVAAAGVLLLLGGGPPAQHDLAAMSPVPKAALDLDTRLRADLGVPDVGPLLVVQGATAEAVLRREDGLMRRIGALVREKVLAGVDAANRLLPSVATQELRRAALPSRKVLAARIGEASKDLPFQPTAFDPFLNDVAAARALPPVRPEDVRSIALAERISPLLFSRHGSWFGIVVPRGVSDRGRLIAAIPNRDGMTWLDMRAEADGLLQQATAQAWRWLAGGGVAAFAALALSLRDWRRLARVAGAVGASLLIAFAVLALMGERFSLLQIVAIQLVAGVGLDYALFFARPQLDEEERSRTLRTLVTCNIMSLLTFGLLAFCRTPLLREIGVTVAVGMVSAMACAFMFAGELQPAAVVEV